MKMHASTVMRLQFPHNTGVIAFGNAFTLVDIQFEKIEIIENREETLMDDLGANLVKSRYIRISNSIIAQLNWGIILIFIQYSKVTGS